MKDVFIKKYWAEEDILFYIHFHDGEAVKQIEITPKGKTFLTSNNPIASGSILYDQAMDELDLEEKDFITEDEFNKIWIEQ